MITSKIILLKCNTLDKRFVVLIRNLPLLVLYMDAMSLKLCMPIQKFKSKRSKEDTGSKK